MRIVIFGGSGMVGQGVLRECLMAADVDEVVVVGRTALEVSHPKLKQVVTHDVTALSPHAVILKETDACFFCLGVSSSGMNEQDYTRLTQTLTLDVASQLVALSPQMTFIYVSGGGTDSTEHGRSMWARVKGRTENALLKLPFAHVCLFRPGVIQPLDGIISKTPSYRIFYRLLGPLLSVARGVLPNQILTTRSVGRAMLNAVRQHKSGVLEAAQIAQLASAN